MPETSVSPAKQSTVTGCAVRLLWMLAGNIALFFLAIAVARHEAMAVSWRDLAFVGVVAIIVAARFLDVACLDGKTAEGEPATRADWARFATRLGVAATAALLAAHALAATGWLS